MGISRVCGRNLWVFKAFYSKIGRVFVFWGRYPCIFSIFPKCLNTFLNNTFEYFGILWNALEYLGIL